MADDCEETEAVPAGNSANSDEQALQEESQMVCPDCKVEMEDLGDRWECPFCGFVVWKQKGHSNDIVAKDPDGDSF